LIPTTGQRNTQKVFGAVEIRRPCAHFILGEAMFGGPSYVAFLGTLADAYPGREVYLIHDNAPYHEATEVHDWLTQQRGRFHVISLPKYSPELNAQERIWHHVRVKATHNRYYPTKAEFVSVLGGTLRDIMLNPEQIGGYLIPFL